MFPMLSGPGGKHSPTCAGARPGLLHAKGFYKVYPREFCLPDTRLPRDNRLAPGTAEPSPGPVPYDSGRHPSAALCAVVGPGPAAECAVDQADEDGCPPAACEMLAGRRFAEKGRLRTFQAATFGKKEYRGPSKRPLLAKPRRMPLTVD